MENENIKDMVELSKDYIKPSERKIKYTRAEFARKFSCHLGKYGSDVLFYHLAELQGNKTDWHELTIEVTSKEIISGWKTINEYELKEIALKIFDKKLPTEDIIKELGDNNILIANHYKGSVKNTEYIINNEVR